MTEEAAVSNPRSLEKLFPKWTTDFLSFFGNVFLIFLGYPGNVINITAHFIIPGSCMDLADSSLINYR
jgi:hypothetical protein